MSAQLQITLSDEEMERLRQLADREHLSVDDWIKRILRDAGAESETSAGTPPQILAALQRAKTYGHPTADIDEMLRQIESGYLK